MSWAVSQIQGRVGGVHGGRDVNASITRGKVDGRIGGAVMGWDINLTFDLQGNLTGRLGGIVVGRSVTGHFSADDLEVRLGGSVIGFDVKLQRDDDRIIGRMGGRHIGNSFDLTYNERTQVLTGRIGGQIDGKDVNLQLHREASPMLAALLAGAAVYQMELERRSRSNNS